MVQKMKLPRRTTVSLSEDAAKRLQACATARRESPLAVIRLAVQQFLDAETGTEVSGESSAITQARRLVEASRGLTNPYQEILGAWRIDRTARQMFEIRGFRLGLDAHPPEQYLLNILTEVLQKLGQLDDFLVVTDPAFWRAASGTSQGVFGPESAKMYLTAQKNAVAKGMGLIRVFQLSSREEVHDPVMQPHRQFLAELKQEKAKVDVRWRVVDDLNDPAKPRIRQFACVRRRPKPDATLTHTDPDDGCLVVEPVYYSGSGIIKDLRFLFSHGSSHDDMAVKFYLDRFFHALDGAQPLD